MNDPVVGRMLDGKRTVIVVPPVPSYRARCPNCRGIAEEIPSGHVPAILANWRRFRCPVCGEFTAGSGAWIPVKKTED